MYEDGLHIKIFNGSIRPLLAVTPQDTVIISEGEGGGVTVINYETQQVRLTQCKN